MLRTIKKMLVPLFVLLSVSSLNTGCEIDQLAESIDEARDKINEGIDKIIADSDRWKEIVLEDILPFIDEELDWLIADLNALVEKTAQEMQAHTLCIADRADDRVVNGLRTILSDIDGFRRHQFIIPYVCSASPSVLDLHVSADHRRNIQISGVDFVDEKAFQLFFRKNGNDTPVVQDRIAKTSNYLLQINATDWDSTLKNYEYLVVKYNGLQLTEIPIYK